MKYQCRIRQKINSGRRHEGQAEGATVEEAWVEFKEAILSMAVEVCGMKRSKGQQKRTKWWNNEVKKAVRMKKIVSTFTAVATSDISC